jgi:hypothetical protein
VARPQTGRIVRVVALDPQGKNPKRRPFVIVDESANPLVGVAISAEFKPNDPNYVELPWHAQGRVVTKLKKRCAAVCNWIQTFNESEILEYGGVVPTAIFKQVLTKIAKMNP